MSKKTVIRVGQKTRYVTVTPELVFRRALVLSNSRPEVGVGGVLSKPVTSVPTSLFKEDGMMRNTKKSDLVSCLAPKDSCLPVLSAHSLDHTVYIRDAMGVIHALDGDKYRSFEDWRQFTHVTCYILSSGPTLS